MIAAAILVAALGSASPTSNAFLADFGGTWTCMEGKERVRWVIGRVPNSRWVEVQWGVDPKTGVPDGIAFVGYVTGMHQWIYRDFHGDGAYSEIHASNPVDHTWTWLDPYYPYGGGVLRGHVIWKLADATHIARTFVPETGPPGHDECVKS